MSLQSVSSAKLSPDQESYVLERLWTWERLARRCPRRLLLTANTSCWQAILFPQPFHGSGEKGSRQLLGLEPPASYRVPFPQASPMAGEPSSSDWPAVRREEDISSVPCVSFLGLIHICTEGKR